MSSSANHTLSGRRIWLGALLMAAMAVAIASFRPEAPGRPTAPDVSALPVAMDELDPVDPPPNIGGADNQMAVSNLAARKKLELPFEMNLAECNLPVALNWIETQLDLEFRPQVEMARLAGITANIRQQPLIEFLSEVLLPRDVSVMLQRGVVVLAPSTIEERDVEIDGETRIEQQVEIQVETPLDEPIDLYFGPKGQFRVFCLPRSSDTGEPAQAAVYHHGQLSGSASLELIEDEWATPEFEMLEDCRLSLQVRSIGDDQAELRMRFTRLLPPAAQ